jgi:hypothetical protein
MNQVFISEFFLKASIQKMFNTKDFLISTQKKSHSTPNMDTSSMDGFGQKN